MSMGIIQKGTPESQDHGRPSDGLTVTDALYRYKGEPLGDLIQYLSDYIVFRDGESVVIASLWIMASWLTDIWSYFPILAITSPEPMCGKTTLLGLIQLVTPRSSMVASLSPAALYRSIGNGRIVTLLYDEAQILGRKGSEMGEQLKEILCASVRKDSSIMRCGGKKNDFDPIEFKPYGPKVVACIDKVDPVIASRCLPIDLQRKVRSDITLHVRERDVPPRAKAIKDKLEKWAEVAKTYLPLQHQATEYPDIVNDRMADGLLPLKTLLEDDDLDTSILISYAERIERKDSKSRSQSNQNRMLASCRDIFDEPGCQFIESSMLVAQLNSIEDERWCGWNDRTGINAHNVAKLLDGYDIKPRRNSKGNKRGYYREDFEEAFGRYLSPSLYSPQTVSDCQSVRGETSETVRECQTPEECQNPSETVRSES